MTSLSEQISHLGLLELAWLPDDGALTWLLEVETLAWLPEDGVLGLPACSRSNKINLREVKIVYIQKKILYRTCLIQLLTEIYVGL